MRQLTRDTKIRLSQIKDLLTWRQVTDWDENEHPRGNPGNKGQFKSKNGGKAKQKAKRRKRTVSPFILETTQTVYKRDQKGNVINSDWEIRAGTQMLNPEVMYQGNQIRDVERLTKDYPGTKEEDWTKETGIAIINPKKNAKNKKGKLITKSRKAEIHYYRSKKTGPVEFKRIKWEQ